MKKLKDLNCILLIDDDPATNFLNKLVIEDAALGAYIKITEGGQEALEYLTCTGRYSNETKYPQPGIILLDINMPGMNGWEFMEEYKKLPDEQKGKILLVMLTTSLNPDDRKRAGMIEDIEDFVSKPLSPEALKKILETHYSEAE